MNDTRLRIYSFKTQTNKLQSLGMWDLAVTQARKTLESICVEICEEEKLTGKRPVSSHSLDDLISIIEKSSIGMPMRFPKIMRALQSFGNFTTHDQRELSSVTKNTCDSCLALLEELFQWFAEKYIPNLPDLPVPETDTQPISGEHEDILPKDLQFAENHDSNLDIPVKVKSPSQNSASSKSVEFYSQLKQGCGNLENPLKELFSQASNLGLKLEWGSKSRVVKTAFKVAFPDESLQNTSETGHVEKRQGFERNFNFGVFKSTGIFYNRSCERSLGRNYLTRLSLIIPETKVRLHKNEFRNSIVQISGDPVPLEWILSRKNEWIHLVSNFLKNFKSIGI